MSDRSDGPRRSTAERLAEALASVLGVRPKATLDELFAIEGQPYGVTAGSMVRPTLRVEEHHDLTPDLFVYDPYLGTIGLVEVLAQPDRTVAEALREAIDRAAYFRQLCLLHAERTARLAHGVELVLVFASSLGPQAKLEATSVLHKLADETAYLRSIGVNMLDEAPDGTFPGLRGTFPWLLSATRKWFASSRSDRAAPVAGDLGPWMVGLRNYRHRGGRTYRFAAGRFHVMHGYNGSGKSTLSEALELLLTGAIDRLDRKGKTRYFPFVRHQALNDPNGPPGGPRTAAKVFLRLGTAAARIEALVQVEAPEADRAEVRRTIWRGIDPPPPLPAAASFRLDQRLMDEIIQANDSRRAVTFLTAFFPRDREHLEAEEASAAAADAAFSRLPAPLRAREAEAKMDPFAFVRENLSWTTEDAAAWRPRLEQAGGMLEMIAPCLPASPEQIRLLSRLDPSLASTLQRWETAPSTIVIVAEEIERLDQAIAGVRQRAPGLRRQIDLALPILRRFNDWRAGRSIDTVGTLKETVDQWLELQALADLVAKYHDVAATLERARAQGWTPRPEHLSLFEPVHESIERLEFLRQCRDDLAHQRDTARHRVRALSVDDQKDLADTARAPAVLPRHLSAAEIQALDQLGNILPSLSTESGAVPFGQLLNRAVGEDVAQARGRITIGVRGGLEAAIKEAESIEAACRAIEAADLSVAAAFLACRTTVEAFDTLAAKEAAAARTFFNQLVTRRDDGIALMDALNELLALFKPAPWAYSGIVMQANRRRGHEPERLGLRRQDGEASEAELLLNTAELNTFTFALFLLCAPALPNPLKLLVLDDPLQNMDEMTVSSLARGVGKLMRIYPDGWRILALFHGEEDVYRIRDEVETNVYRLPWVSARDAWAAGMQPVRAVAMPGTERLELQNIRQLVAVRAAAAAG